MGKRKQVAPQHAGEAKRQQLQWNMTDQTSSSSVSKVANTNHTLQKEDTNQHPAESTSLSSSPVSDDNNASISQTPLHALCVDAFYQNLASCHSALTLLNKRNAQAKMSSGALQFGSFKVTLIHHHHLMHLPGQLPEFKECWLYLASGDNPHMLYFETEDNNENVIQKKLKSRQSKFGVFWFASVTVPVEAISGLKIKSFWIACEGFDAELKELTVTIYGSKDMVMHLSHPSEGIRVKSSQIAIQRLMDYYYDIAYPFNFRTRPKTTAHDFFDLYENVMLVQREKLNQDLSWEEDISQVHHCCLKPVLRPYQKESVAWMLRQEKKGAVNSSSEPKDMHPLYCEVKLRDGTLLYYNRYAGSFIKNRPDAIPPLPGGILADEMGLGKTVEILCCMLLNPRQGLELPEPLPVLDDESTTAVFEEVAEKTGDEIAAESKLKFCKPVSRKQYFECNCGQLESEEETLRKGLHTVKCLLCGMSQHAECMNYDLSDPLRGDYLCPHCHATSSKIKSGATLIISPNSICHQWIDEINKHIKERSIKVFIYTGVSKLGYIQPQTLAQQDIVITTYNVLHKEVDYANIPHTNGASGRRFRHPKRFLATPSPMVAVEWWRICLDEAQMVECVTTKTAEMAMRLKAVNRWCVTGTPLMKSVEDIYGLLLFLALDPFLVQQWFKSFIWEPFCRGICGPMYHTLAQVFWRTAKKDVIDQIQLPAQSEETNWLTFSPVEEHFYRRQYEVYQSNAYTVKSKTKHWQHSNLKLHSLDRKSMNELLNPLFRLRQACCHPQIVRGALLPINKTMMSMDEVLDHMIKKAKTECEEGHRQIVASLNGLAGLAILRGQLLQAVDHYREVLMSVAEHKDEFRTDDLQQLHAMHNLAFVLDQKPEGLAPTLRDDSLREECESLKKKYMNKALIKTTAAEGALQQTKDSIDDINQSMAVTNAQDWWADIVELCIQRSIDRDLIDKVKDDLSRTSRAEGSIVNIFRSTDALLYVVDSHLQTLNKARVNLTTELELLSKNTTPELVQEAALCCLRPVEKVPERCPFCKVDELFNEYESKLFMFVERGVTVTENESAMAYHVNTKRQGTWADSEVEKALKSILSFFKLHFDNDQDIVKAANLQLKHFEVLKKEFKNLRAVWLGHRDRVSAIDELEMAVERLRYKLHYEPESAYKLLNVIEKGKMKLNHFKFKNEEVVGRTELRKKQGQLMYLTNLAKQSQEGEDHNPELCPICQSEFGVEWSVMLCGHCFCLRCVRILMDRNLIGYTIHHEQRLRCPLCRNLMSVKEIAYVTTRKKDQQVDVKGSHSTKVQAIVECLIKIWMEDPIAKSLVFSTWVTVLDILGAALTENNIPYRFLHDSHTFQKNLSAFKEDKSIRVLLLNLHTGANGLNLVEANHVLLVEPELNLEHEAQAISRICRIGQTRQTKIHRFLVRGTIEEKIHDMVQTLRNSKTGATEKSENLELTVGDITSLIEQPCPDENEEEGPSTSGNASSEVDSTLPAVGGNVQPHQVQHGRTQDALPSTSFGAISDDNDNLAALLSAGSSQYQNEALIPDNFPCSSSSRTNIVDDVPCTSSSTDIADNDVCTSSSSTDIADNVPCTSSSTDIADSVPCTSSSTDIADSVPCTSSSTDENRDSLSHSLMHKSPHASEPSHLSGKLNQGLGVSTHNDIIVNDTLCTPLSNSRMQVSHNCLTNSSTDNEHGDSSAHPSGQCSPHMGDLSEKTTIDSVELKQVQVHRDNDNLEPICNPALPSCTGEQVLENAFPNSFTLSNENSHNFSPIMPNIPPSKLSDLSLSAQAEIDLAEVNRGLDSIDETSEGIESIATSSHLPERISPAASSSPDMTEVHSADFNRITTGGNSKNLQETSCTPCGGGPSTETQTGAHAESQASKAPKSDDQPSLCSSEVKKPDHSKARHCVSVATKTSSTSEDGEISVVPVPSTSSYQGGSSAAPAVTVTDNGVSSGNLTVETAAGDAPLQDFAVIDQRGVNSEVKTTTTTTTTTREVNDIGILPD